MGVAPATVPHWVSRELFLKQIPAASQIEQMQQILSEQFSGLVIEPPYQPSPYQQPPYQPPAGWQPYQQPTGFYPPQKRKTPGKGFAITSMIMGIFALLYSFEQIGGLLGLLLYPLQPFYDYSSGATALANALSGLSGGVVFVTLALVFGAVARSKGYRRGMSTAGLILGGIAGGIYVLSILLSIVVATML